MRSAVAASAARLAASGLERRLPKEAPPLSRPLAALEQQEERERGRARDGERKLGRGGRSGEGTPESVSISALLPALSSGRRATTPAAALVSGGLPGFSFDGLGDAAGGGGGDELLSALLESFSLSGGATSAAAGGSTNAQQQHQLQQQQVASSSSSAALPSFERLGALGALIGDRAAGAAAAAQQSLAAGVGAAWRGNT